MPKVHLPSDSSNTARRLRGAFVMLREAEKVAANDCLPLAARQHALTEAHRHLAASWSLLTTWAVEGAPAADAARAGELLGESNRRLPLLAAALRAEAGFTPSWDREAAL